MRRIILFLSLALSLPALADETADWRKTGSMQDKVDNLVEVVPGAAVLMLQMGERYRNLYWAGRLGKWEFANYQIEEMQDLVNTLIITRPARAATAREFLAGGFEKFPEAIESKDWRRFTVAFEHMRQSCMACHAQNDHAFITLSRNPRRGNSPALE